VKPASSLPPELLEILVCPQCLGALEPLADGTGLACGRCALCYPVRDGIPVMIPAEASAWPARGQSGGAGR
jgi:hypothetical protein